jgi:hypothetical protein
MPLRSSLALGDAAPLHPVLAPMSRWLVGCAQGAADLALRRRWKEQEIRV